MFLGIDRTICSPRVPSSQVSHPAITPQGFLVPTNKPAEEIFPLWKLGLGFPRCSDGTLGSQVMEREGYFGLKTSLSSTLIDNIDMTRP